jgi:hypothetical protein
VTPAIRSILVTLVVAFIAGLGGVWAGKLIFGGQQQAPNLHQVVHRELSLNAYQQQRIDALERDFTPKRQALEMEMRAANADLAAAIREEHGYGPHVTAAVERFHHAMGQLQIDTIQHVFAMREVMTPDQKARFDNIVSAALTAEPH